MKKDYRLQQIIDLIKEFADKDLEGGKNPDGREPNDYIMFGRATAFAASLTVIQEELDDDERKVYGLDFDIDKKYL